MDRKKVCTPHQRTVLKVHRPKKGHYKLGLSIWNVQLDSLSHIQMTVSAVNQLHNLHLLPFFDKHTKSYVFPSS